MLEPALYTFLHILVFVYWLGGDLGAFYASRYLIKPGVIPANRLLAAKIVGDVDMAPRTALILTFPTGLLLAIAKGWLPLSMLWGFVALVAALIWLGLAWAMHVRPGQAASLKPLDTALRWAVLAGSAGWGFAGLFGVSVMPLFLSIKLLLFAAAIAAGLWIRQVLKPLSPALAGLAGPDAEQHEAVLSRTLRTARLGVVSLWLLIAAAAFLGLWTPIAL